MQNQAIEELDRKLVPKRLSPSRLAHIVIKTCDYEKMRDFYLEFLNARVAFENGILAFLRYDDEHHRLVIAGLPGLEPANPAGTGLEHFAFTFDTMGDLLSNYLRLKALGISPVWCVNHGFTTSIYYADPDGNKIETQFDNMDCESADAFMQGEYYAKNPIGVDFDPELLCERYERGDPLSELVKQTAARLPADAPHVPPPGLPPYDYRGELI